MLALFDTALITPSAAMKTFPEAATYADGGDPRRPESCRHRANAPLDAHHDGPESGRQFGAEPGSRWIDGRPAAVGSAATPSGRAHSRRVARQGGKAARRQGGKDRTTGMTTWSRMSHETITANLPWVRSSCRFMRLRPDRFVADHPLRRPHREGAVSQCRNPMCHSCYRSIRGHVGGPRAEFWAAAPGVRGAGSHGAPG